MILNLKKNGIKLAFTAFACFALSACGSDPAKETGTPSNSQNEVYGTNTPTQTPSESPTAVPTESADITPFENNTPSPQVTPSTKYHVTVYDNLSKGTRVDLAIEEGDSVEINEFTQLLGYDFTGCYDTLTNNREMYIDAHGNVCSEIVSDMVLYAWYEPKNYTLTFTCNGKNASLYGIQNVNASYDSDLREVLPLDKIINENELIYSVSYKHEVLADILAAEKVPLNEAILKDTQIFTSNSKIVIDLATVNISQSVHHGTQEVCIKDDYDQFEQSFKDEYICDSLSFKNLNFELLEQLGYNTAVIELSCCIRERDNGTQEIYVYNKAYENNPTDSKKTKKSKKKEMDDYLLGKYEYDCEKEDVEETTEHTITVSLSRLKASDGIYVYYGASGFSDDDWYRVFTDISITFERRLDK